MPETAKRTARVPILGEDGRISDDYIPAAIGENVTKAESAATRAEAAKTDAEAAKTGAESFANNAVAQAQAAKESADGARGSASRAQQSATAAQQSATEAGERADSVLDHYVESATATTLDPGQPATAEVVDKVLNLGIPRGEKGDRGDTGTGVPEGGTPGQLLAKTDSGTAWVDPPSGNVLTGTATGYAAHADDAYAAKPREVRVKGRTVKNLWPVINGTLSGITVSTDETGLITVSGTKTTDTIIYFSVHDVLSAGNGTQLTALRSSVSNVVIPYVNTHPSNASVIGFSSSSSSSGTIPNDDAELRCGIRIEGAVGTQVDASFRVMLVEGSEAPDCFTPPASITSVQTGNLVTAGKNLADIIGSTQDNAKPIPVKEGQKFIASCTASKPIDDAASNSHVYMHNAITRDVIGVIGFTTGTTGRVTSNVFTAPSDGAIIFVLYSTLNLTDVQLEPGSTATAYEPPAVTETPLPEVELRSLPDGTRDELVIGADGACEVERRTQLVDGEVVALGTPTTEPQSPVMLPKLPAPTFNVYHDSQVPSDTSVEYERDVNIAYAELEAKIAALTVVQATS